MVKELKELWSYRELLYVMVQRELRIRYKNSALGLIWSFLNPLFQVLVMTFAFKVFLNVGGPSHTVYMLSAYLPFMFFQTCVLDSSQSILLQLPLIKKIYFPREILPLACVFANLIHLLIGFIIFFAILLFVYFLYPGVVPFQATTIFLPILIVISFMLATGASFIVSAFNTFYEDVKYIVTVIMNLMFYLCPIMYYAEHVANSQLNKDTHWLLYKLYNLNPLAALSHGYRKVLLAHIPVKINGEMADPMPTPWKYIAVSGVFAFCLMVFGYWVFNRLKWKFVERP
ncbi:MAG: ABC transporter permease [Armatimonadota bacterium]